VVAVAVFGLVLNFVYIILGGFLTYRNDTKIHIYLTFKLRIIVTGFWWAGFGQFL